MKKRALLAGLLLLPACAAPVETPAQTPPTFAPTDLETEEPDFDEPDLVPPTMPNVYPGASCATKGSAGSYRGRLYICKGPAPYRWRRQ